MLDNVEINVYLYRDDTIHGLFDLTTKNTVSVNPHTIERPSGDSISGSEITEVYSNDNTKTVTFIVVESPCEVLQLMLGQRKPVNLSELPSSKQDKDS